MSVFDEYAENYSIADREFKVRLSGAEVLCLIALIQVARASTPEREKFEYHFPEALQIARGIIEVVCEVDPAAGEQLKSGWGL
jgi:hypothetical protein